MSKRDRDPLFENIPELATRRLLLRKLRPEDLASLHEQNSDPEVSRYMGWQPARSIAETGEYLEDVLERYDRHYPTPWGIELRASGELIGRCGFETWHLIDSRAEVSFALARHYWGVGYMTEALVAVIDHGFGVMELNRIEGHCDSDNLASARVMEKAGMSREGIHRQILFRNGGFRDMIVYAVLRQEWSPKGFII